ncbi:hypothetical protein P154DRAFT_294725 [Amniculicola lignicola CBS 123094]|uniref:Uncharacterized protein n=1 Tax=Amniculicola lignicola CBS 123094 TaxID=1392246 RepID=A0A6A5WI42_9PLEO|nr:hypothetical protein P154DRAFT_294725 [Amniculicola lignicola CBS 123094]
MGIGETITVINRSGKVVSSSKHVFSVFKEARSAYRERKAEIQAERKAASTDRVLHDGVKALRIKDDDDTRSRTSSRTHRTSRSKTHRPAKPALERGYTDSFYDEPVSPRRRHRYSDDLDAEGRDGPRRELMRRHTEMPIDHYTPAPRRRSSDIDMDLAYGELPPPLPGKPYDDNELKEKAFTLTHLLEEANCLQYSVTTMIDNLQKNPEALAAVALTLGEISTIVGKMGPGVLTVLKGSFPAVVALLASPQFMIAAGVGVGVTIVALGGYKIIKRIQATTEEKKVMEVPFEVCGSFGGPVTPSPQEQPYQLDELETQELSRIELWRRGIADVAAGSDGTTVDGEFMTPGASRQFFAEGVLDEEEVKSRRHSKSHRAKSTKSSRTGATRKKEGGKKDKDGKEKKKKEPSLMKSLFRAHSH